MSYTDLIRQNAGILAVAFLAVFTGNLGQSFFIGLFQVSISQQLNLTAGEFGNIYAAITITSGFLVMYFGPKIDWVVPKQYALFVLVALISGILLLTLSSWWLIAVLGLGLLRLSGQGLMTHFGLTLTGREFTKTRGKALGLMGLAMPSGEIILPPLIALMLAWLSWQQVWWCVLAALVVLWLYLFIFVDWPEAPQTKQAIKEQPVQTKSPMTELRFWLLIPMLLVLPMTLTGIFLYQAQLTEDLGASATTYALALTMMGFTRFPIALLGGHWVDKLGVELLARTYLLPYAATLLFAAFIGGNIGVWVLMLGAGIAMSISTPVGDSLLVKLWGKERLGRVRSLKSAFLVFSTGVTPALLGFLLDHAIQFQTILIGMFVYLVIAWILAQSPIRQASQA
jgi:DHA1 family purine base/nucleoside efflux pump-like MFS transporter